MRILRLLLTMLLGLPLIAAAHKPSDSYLTLRTDGAGLIGRWDIALRDLDAVLDLDTDRDGRITWGEVRTRLGEIQTYALGRLTLTQGKSACPLIPASNEIDRHTDGAYLVLHFTGTCTASIGALGIDYRLLFDVDAQHRGLVKLDASNGAVVTAVFAADTPKQSLSPAGTSRWRQMGSFIADGISHIALGYDHILFLVALLLPAVLGRAGRGWVPLPRLRQALWNVAQTVTAFTLAHSITLSLATLQVVQLPSRLTESLIAASVLITAIDNLVPVLPARRWIVAFAFGLMHGFGFASVLVDLQLPRSALALSLFGFNAGVEIGQLVLVFALIPLAYLARATRWYQPVPLRAGSVAIALLACGWLVERSLNVKLMPF